MVFNDIVLLNLCYMFVVYFCGCCSMKESDGKVIVYTMIRGSIHCKFRFVAVSQIFLYDTIINFLLS